MLVYDIKYAGENENLSFLIEDNENAVHVALAVMRKEIKDRIAAHDELLSTCFGHSQCVRYHTATMNDYTRLLVALEYVFTINDLRDINYISVKTRVVYSED